MHAPAEHTASYYAASRNDDTEYPRLEGTHCCDVAVVGAGFTGISTALHLAERGRDVALIEANRVGWGASGRNGGQLIDGFVDVDKIERRFGTAAGEMAWRMGIECRDIVVQRIERHRIDCDLKFGFIDVAVRDAQMRDLERRLDTKLRRGYPHALAIVPRERMPEYLGSERYIGGLSNAGNGHLHPLNLAMGETRAAVQQGVTVFEQSPVTGIVHGNRPRVRTAAGDVVAGIVVLAGNAYLGRTEPSLYGRVIPAGSYMIASEPLSESDAGEVVKQDIAFCEQGIGLNYFRLSADRRLLFGGMCNYSGRRPADISAALRPRMLKIFPRLEDAVIDFEWGGDIAISLNRVPQFGRLGGNVYYAQGYSGHGVAPTHLAGRMLADAICGDSERFDVFARVRHWRLPGGKWFANPALALGMLYHRLKEIL